MRITNLKDVRAAVWAGIGYLNVHRPGWRRKINLEKLDLADPTCCVLGEVYGDYSIGTNALGFQPGEAEKFGFYIPNTAATAENPQRAQYQRLTAEWRAAYRAGQRQGRTERKAKAARA
jgi:hypothetical protein